MAGTHGGWNAAEMESAARTSEGRECFREITSGEYHRVGLVAAALPSSCVLFSVEVSLRLCRTEGEVRPGSLEETASFSRWLERRGYVLNHLDDGWIVCEKALLKEEIASELECLLKAVRRRGGRGRSLETERAAPYRRG